MKVINLWKIFCGALLIVVAWLALSKGCTPKPATDLVKLNEALVKKVKQDSIDRYNGSISYAQHVAKVSAEKTAQAAKLNKSEILLYQSQGKINSLVRQLAIAKDQPFDSSFIYVSPDYITACDSLGIVASNQDILLKDAKGEKDGLIDLMNYETTLRDSMVNVERENLNTLRADFNAQTHFFKQAIKNGKARTKFFTGISAIGNKEQLFGGGEVSIMLLTKKEQAYEIGSGFFGSQWYVRGGTKFKIKF